MRQGTRREHGRRVAVMMMATSTVLASGCIRRPRVGGPDAIVPGESPTTVRRVPTDADLAAVYQRMGLLVSRGDVPFVGGVASFAGAVGDSTLLLLSLSMTNRALTFQREGDRYRAPYEVRIEVRRGDSTVRRIAADELVRVATFKETSRADESVLFFQYVALSPAAYTLTVAVRDVNSGRSASVEAPLRVPRLGAGALSTPVLAYESTPRDRLDTLPRLTTSARATTTFGQDSVASLYVEGYGTSGDVATRLPLRLTVRGERDAIVWSDTASIERQTAMGVPGNAATPALYGGVVRLPVSRLGIGVVSLDVVARDAALGASSLGASSLGISSLGAPPLGGTSLGTAARSDSTRASLFVSLGPDLPISSFDEMLGYLRYYATPDRLRALRETPAETRAATWLAFLHEIDSVNATPEHEALRDYFARVRSANARFAEEGGPGWLTDRGMTYIVLGEPDQIGDPTGQDASARGRTQVWEYRTDRMQLTFADQTGFGRWRLTPASLAQVQQVMRRKMVR